jgi:hypothetical protein
MADNFPIDPALTAEAECARRMIVLGEKLRLGVIDRDKYQRIPQYSTALEGDPITEVLKLRITLGLTFDFDTALFTEAQICGKPEWTAVLPFDNLANLDYFPPVE